MGKQVRVNRRKRQQNENSHMVTTNEQNKSNIDTGFEERPIKAAGQYQI